MTSPASIAPPLPADPPPPAAVPAAAAPADWRASLPVELRDDPAFAGFRDVGALAKSYAHARRMVGRERIAVPGRGAAPEDWAEVFDRLGRPAAPEGYAFDRPRDDDLPYDEALETAFRGRAHALGLLPDQARGLFDWWCEMQRAATAQGRRAEAEGAERAERDLRETWGAALPRTLMQAETAVRRFGDAQLEERFEAEWRRDPAFLRFAAAVGETLAEDRLAPAEPGAGLPGPGEAKRRIAAVFADPRHAYFRRGDAGHQRAVEEVRALFEAAYG